MLKEEQVRREIVLQPPLEKCHPPHITLRMGSHPSAQPIWPSLTGLCTRCSSDQKTWPRSPSPPPSPGPPLATRRGSMETSSPPRKPSGTPGPTPAELVPLDHICPSGHGGFSTYWSLTDCKPPHPPGHGWRPCHLSTVTSPAAGQIPALTRSCQRTASSNFFQEAFPAFPRQQAVSSRLAHGPPEQVFGNAGMKGESPSPCSQARAC